MTEKLPKWFPSRITLAKVLVGVILGSSGMRLGAPILSALIPGLQFTAQTPTSDASPRESDHDKLIRTRTDVDHLIEDLRAMNGKLDDIGAALGVQFVKQPAPRTRRSWADRDRDLREAEPTR